MTKSKDNTLGIIQSRGLGDIVIALPIAREYWTAGYDIFWPILEEFIPHFEHHVDWVKWIPIPYDDQGRFFYDAPLERLTNFKVKDVIPLYQALTGHPEFTQRPEFQITKFDQIKYHIAGVPFLKKWTLNTMVKRDYTREQALKLSLNIEDGEEYVVVHRQGSDFVASIDPAWCGDYKVIEITNATDSVFDWLGVLESATAGIFVDSVFSNIMDQWGLTEQVDCYFIPRSHIHLTPVLGGKWTVIDPTPETLKRISIFKSS